MRGRVLMILASAALALQLSQGYSTPTAREISRMTMLSEMKTCTMANIFAQRASKGASVGPKVELCVNATKR